MRRQTMSNPAIPGVSRDDQLTGGTGQPGPPPSIPDPDEPNPFGPDAPNVREDDPPGGQVAPRANPPKPPDTPLDHGDFGPDER
jgi:hypothetical protein